MRRDTILEAVAEFLPDLLPYALLTLNDNTHLHFGNFTFDSAEGVQQGDPLGPLYFCLAIHKLLLSLNCEFIVGYLDDITIGDSVDIVLADLLHIEVTAKAMGLQLNRAKSEVIGCTAATRDVFLAAGVSLVEVPTNDAVLLVHHLRKQELTLHWKRNVESWQNYWIGYSSCHHMTACIY